MEARELNEERAHLYTEVARRYDYGAGVKFIPVPGVGLFFDFIKPINKNEGLTADLSWRIGGQVLF